MNIVVNRIMARMAENEAHPGSRPNDFLNHYLEEYDQSEQVDFSQVLGWLMVNVRKRGVVTNPEFFMSTIIE